MRPNESFAAGEENSICGSLLLATTSDFERTILRWEEVAS
jgi:hypothetical protein